MLITKINCFYTLLCTHRIPCTWEWGSSAHTKKTDTLIKEPCWVTMGTFWPIPANITHRLTDTASLDIQKKKTPQQKSIQVERCQMHNATAPPRASSKPDKIKVKFSHSEWTSEKDLPPNTKRCPVGTARCKNPTKHCSTRPYRKVGRWHIACQTKVVHTQ